MRADVLLIDEEEEPLANGGCDGFGISATSPIEKTEHLNHQNCLRRQVDIILEIIFGLGGGESIQYTRYSNVMQLQESCGCLEGEGQ